METHENRDALAARVRGALAAETTTERRMFGGVAFLVGGNMLCCASGKGLMVRVGREREAEALARPHASLCLGTGRPMSGFIMVDPAGVATDAAVAGWLALARSYVDALPAKAKAEAKAPRRPARSKA